MATTGLITMSTRELDRLQIIHAVVGGNLKTGLAVEQPGLTNTAPGR
jgi:hypothetical protein